MVNVKKGLFCLVLLIPAFNAFSENIKTAGDLDQLQMQRAYYEALAAVNKAKNEADTQPNGTSGAYINQNQAGQQTTSATEIVLPTVIKITGGISGMKANIAIPGGGESSYSTGDVIPGGYKILLISMKGVSVQQISTGKKLTLN